MDSKQLLLRPAEDSPFGKKTINANGGNSSPNSTPFSVASVPSSYEYDYEDDFTSDDESDDISVRLSNFNR